MIVADAGNNSAFLRTVSTWTSTSSQQFREGKRVPPEETQPLAPSVLTMGQWLDEWLELCARRGLRPSTVASYETMILRCERDIDQSRR
jgi:hypothetical protein